MCVYFQLGSHKRVHLVTWSPRLVIDVLFQDLLSPPAAGKSWESLLDIYMAVCQNLVPLVNIKIAGKWMFIPLKMELIGIDPYPYMYKYIYI